MMPSCIEKICSFFKKTEMCKKNIYRLCNVKRLEQDIKSRCNPHIKCMKTEVFFCKNDMHVRPVRFSILCTPTDSSDKNPIDVFYHIAVLVYI